MSRTPLPEVLERQQNPVEPDAPRIESDDAPLPQDVLGSFIKGRMADIMGNEGKSEELDLELSNILEWARNKGAESPESIFWEIRELMHRLGAPGVGENRVKWVHRYTFLDNQKRAADKEMERMENVN